MSPVNADGRLPRGWWRDPVTADEVHARIRGLIGRGMDDQAVARAVGCSWKTVFRYRESRGIPAQSHGGRPMGVKKEER